MTLLFVTYPGTAGTRFDRDYYVHSHLPLVKKTWGPFGLDTIAAFFPDGEGAGTIAVCVCEFQSEAGMKTALASSDTAPVMADVVKFTDAKPRQSQAAAV